jgi:rRNA maturation RNase YbeY
LKTAVNIINTVTGGRVPRRKLTRLAEIVLAGQRRRGHVNLVFVNDRRMAQLNRKYRNRRGSTDVLSFNLEDDDDPLIGEVYISLAQARRNADKFNSGINREILKLFCHGLLHLCGQHHPDDRARASMERKENRYLTRLESEAAK